VKPARHDGNHRSGQALSGSDEINPLEEFNMKTMIGGGVLAATLAIAGVSLSAPASAETATPHKAASNAVETGHASKATDFSAQRRRYYRARPYAYYGPRYRPYYRSYGYMPRPYYGPRYYGGYGYGGPGISFGFGPGIGFGVGPRYW
jgi:hypothetical protein